jgi:hypothetical protein
VIDELAEILDKSDADTKEEKTNITLCRQAFKKLLRMARSQGVHILGATQSLDKSVMGVAFKVNTAGRICFSVSDANSSMLVINDGSAVNLGPPGRAIFKRGTDKLLVQTPFISPSDIDEIVTNAIEGTTTIKLHGAAYSPVDIVTWAVQENDCNLGQRDVYWYLNKDYPTLEMSAVQNMLMDMEGKTYTVFDYEYLITPGIGRRPRRAVRVVDDQIAGS